MTLSGEWIDVIRFRDWLKADMQTRVFQVLKSNRKVPFTDSGIGLVEGAMERSLKEGQDIGGYRILRRPRENPGSCQTVIIPPGSRGQSMLLRSKDI